MILSPHPATVEEELVDKSPDAFRTISEVAEDLDVPQHVLRFWETRFSQIKPLKRGGGRRYYRPDDVALIQGLKTLLYGQGYTIKGVQRILKEQGVRHVQAIGRGQIAPGPERAQDAPAASVAAPDDTLSARQPALPMAGAASGPVPDRPPHAASVQPPASDLQAVLRAVHDDLADARLALHRALHGAGHDNSY